MLGEFTLMGRSMGRTLRSRPGKPGCVLWQGHTTSRWEKGIWTQPGSRASTLCHVVVVGTVLLGSLFPWQWSLLFWLQMFPNTSTKQKPRGRIHTLLRRQFGYVAFLKWLQPFQGSLFLQPSCSVFQLCASFCPCLHMFIWKLGIKVLVTLYGYRVFFWQWKCFGTK